ncbi:MAG: lipid-A-disaccharide synthase [Chitinivibrionales bacterium]|nr:lipid-A-disaccharide synthase [Chitinivibrionales bacterium]
MGLTTRIGLGPLVLFIAGDPSGDCHAAPIIAKLLQKNPAFAIYGVAGPAMQSAGCMPLMPFEPFNRMGFLEVLLHLGFFLRARKNIANFIRKYRPSVVVCVDYPGFNFLIMKVAARLKIPVVWYIAPQVWAWKPKRAKTLAKFASFIGVIFPFETDYFSVYKQARVEFVGHPLVEALNSGRRTPEPAAQTKFVPGRLRLAIVPGSRVQEIELILAPMMAAYSILKKEFPALSAVVSQYGALSRRLFERYYHYQDVSIEHGPLPELLNGCDCAFVKSGTATLETALRRIPLVVVYKTSNFSYFLLKRLVHLSYIGLPNIVAGEKIVPECIQQQVSGPLLAQAMRPFLLKGEVYHHTVKALERLESQLGNKKPSQEMSERIAAYCVSHRAKTS